MSLFTRDQIENLNTKKNEPDESINYNGRITLLLGERPQINVHHNDHECNSQVEDFYRKQPCTAVCHTGMQHCIVRFTMIRLYDNLYLMISAARIQTRRYFY